MMDNHDEVWMPMSRMKPRKEGVHIVFAPTADPDIPLRTCAWWSVKNQRWEGIVSVFADAITHWTEFPKDPKQERE